MKCPIDQNELVISERQGVEIDYCPTCRGVWLDRGELDKIIDRSEQINATENATNSDYRERDDHRNQSRPGGQQKKKKESFLSELFDFG